MKVSDQATGDGWALYHADTVEVARAMPDSSVGLSVFSPPFADLYTYSDDPLDMGNSRGGGEFFEHYDYLVEQQARVMMPGRLICIHCMQIPILKGRDGYIGVRDFRGDIIRAYEKRGFVYHSEITIEKDPVVAMQRTKAIGLLHKQVKKDSAVSRQGFADYIVVMGKRGENPLPITHDENDELGSTVDGKPLMWQQYANPIWYDINPSDTLQYRSARAEEDERHICPLQLSVIRRCVRLWSAPGDVVWSPFAGIGSEGYVAVQERRRFVGAELKQSYYQQAAENIRRAEPNAVGSQVGLFAAQEATA
jgi:DNA modification methylase